MNKKSKANKIERFDFYYDGEKAFNKNGFYCYFSEAKEKIEELEKKLEAATKLIATLKSEKNNEQ